METQIKTLVSIHRHFRAGRRSHAFVGPRSSILVRVYTYAVCLGTAFLSVASSVARPDDVCIYTIKADRGEIQYLVPKSRFSSLTNEWYPALGDFPVELREHSDTAREHLIKLKKIKQAIRLARVGIYSNKTYAMNTDGSTGASVDRWYMVFGFGYDRPNGELVQPLDYIVVMLLDGTIAEEKSPAAKEP